MQVGSIIFLAEWGDRSMLATVALGASHSPLGETCACSQLEKGILNSVGYEYTVLQSLGARGRCTCCGLAGVSLGAALGHALATLLAVLGGALASKYISERALGFAGGSLFLLFAALTLFGVF